jgi:translation elongation factor EF-1alpha
MVPADGNFTTAIQKGDHKVGTYPYPCVVVYTGHAAPRVQCSVWRVVQLAQGSLAEVRCVACRAQAGEIQGQTRQHARLINLLGVKQLLVGVNKMDSDTAGYKKERYDEIANEMRHMLVRVGWKDDFVNKSVPILPISGWMGDNLIAKASTLRDPAWMHGAKLWSVPVQRCRLSRRDADGCVCFPPVAPRSPPT